MDTKNQVEAEPIDALTEFTCGVGEMVAGLLRRKVAGATPEEQEVAILVTTSICAGYAQQLGQQSREDWLRMCGVAYDSAAESNWGKVIGDPPEPDEGSEEEATISPQTKAFVFRVTDRAASLLDEELAEASQVEARLAIISLLALCTEYCISDGHLEEEDWLDLNGRIYRGVVGKKDRETTAVNSSEVPGG